MEKIINKRIESYVSKLKGDFQQKLVECGLVESNPHESNSLMQYIFDYKKLELTKDDFTKRKRVKNSICDEERCNARRANGEQCTRRRKDECLYCGTHLKGVPHGKVEHEHKDQVKEKKMEVFAQDINGIIYYLDSGYNVYNTEDIVSNKKNPQVIAQYVKNGDKYSIPEFNI